MPLNNPRQILQLDGFGQEHVAPAAESLFISRFGSQGGQGDDLGGGQLVFALVGADALRGFVAVHLGVVCQDLAQKCGFFLFPLGVDVTGRHGV